MADLEKTVKIIFAGEDKEFNNTLSGITGKMDKFSAAADTVSAPLAKATDAILKVDAALAAMVVGGLALAIKESSEFNKSFALISTSIDASGEDLARYRDGVLDYSKTSVKSMADINAALYTAAQAGVSYGDSLNFMSKAEELAVANNANLNTTVDLLTGTMNAYGYGLKDVGHLNDVFFTSTLIGKQTIDDLGQSMGQVVGIAANFGVSFEQLSAAISTLTAKGMETSEAITAVKGVITSIVSPSKEAAEAAKALGLDFSASSLKAHGFGGMMSDIMRATGGSADKMAALFSEVRALNGAMQITGDGMAFFSRALDTIADSTGSSAAAYEKMVNTFANQGQMLVNSAKVLLIDIGTKLEPIAAGVAGSFTQILAGIDDGVKSGAFDPLFKLLEEAGKELSAWFAGIAKALPDALKGLDFSKLVEAFRSLAGAIGDYFGNLDLTSVEDLHDFIQQIIDGIAGLIRVTEGMVEGFRPFFYAIKDFILRVAESDEETQKMIGTIMALGKMVQKTGLYFVAAVMAFDEYGMSLKGVFNIIAGGAQVVWNLLQAFVRLGESMILITTGRLSELPELFNKLREDGGDFGRGLEKIVSGFNQLSAQGTNVQGTMTGVGDSTSRARAYVDQLTKSLDGVPEDTKAKVTVDSLGVDAWQDKIKTGVNLPVLAKIDPTTMQDTETTLVSKFGGGQTIKVMTNLDGSTTIETLGKLREAIPAEKKVDIKPDITQTALTEIKEKSAIIQKTIEWKAKIDIAQIEAATKAMEIMFKSVDSTIANTGKTLTDIIGSYVVLVNQGRGGTSFMEQIIRDESRRRDEALEMQKELIEAETENLKARTEALKNGKDTMIKVDGSGLQPHLEAFMFEILNAIQVRANAEGANFLVGLQK